MSAPRPAVRKKTKTLQRLLETAANLFLEQGFDNVSVAAIAKAAHCSTATVYDIYGNKEGLFAEAISLALTPTLIEWNAETSGFLALLQYTHERIIELSTVRVRRLVRAVIMQPELTKDTFARTDRDNRQQNETALKALIGTSIAEGMLRECDLQVLLDHLRAMTNECILTSLLHGNPQPPLPDLLVRAVFLPLVTEEGARALQQYLHSHAVTGNDVA